MINQSFERRRSVMLASFKGPLTFKDRGAGFDELKTQLNELFYFAIDVQSELRVEMVRLIAESRLLNLPIVLRNKAAGVLPSFQLAEGRSPAELRAIKLIWVGRGRGNQLKLDPLPYIAEAPALTALSTRASTLNMHMRMALAQSTTVRECMRELSLLEAASQHAAAA